MKNWRGWAAFGAVLMVAVGVFQILSGIFGLVNDQWVILGYSGYSLVDVTGLAVWYIAIGAVLLLGGIAIVQGSRFGRIVGVVAASLAIISQLLVLPVHPVWSVVLIVLYVMALIAFVTVKGPLETADEEPVALMDEKAVPPVPAVPPGPAPAAAAAPLMAEEVITEEELAVRLELASHEHVAKGLTLEAEERYKAHITGLQYENRLLKQRVQTLEAPKGWRPWRRA